MDYTISNPNISLKVSSLGAEVVSVIVDGEERQWQNSNGSWSGHAPVLFPFCGNCSLKIGSKIYEMARHGFARKSLFSCVEETENSLTFRLDANEETLKVYPFNFSLDVRYVLSDRGYSVNYVVNNNGKEEMYFSAGGHESFLIDGVLSDYVLEFEKEEDVYFSAHDKDGLLTGEKIHVGKLNSMPLPEDYLENAYTGIIENFNSKSVILRNVKTNKNAVKINLFERNYLLLWHPIGSNMICVEPWLNLPDSYDRVELEFKDKPGVIRLKAGQSADLERSFEYLN